MLSRALSLATVTLLIGCFAAGAAHAQVTNLEAGKSPSQIFAGTCTACHKSPRGLLKSVPASSLPGFLRQHYTTSSDMASVLSSFLVSNGAADTRYQGKDQPKQGKDAKQDGKPVQEARPAGPPDQLDRFGRRLRPAASAQEAARPDADGISPQNEPGRPGRDAKRMARPGETPEAAKPGDGPTTDGKIGAKQKLSKRGRPGPEEPPKPDEAAKGEAAKDDASKSQTAKSDAAKDVVKDVVKDDADKSEAAKPAGEGKSETAKADAPKETVKETAKETGGEATALRPDPVPPVTPAPAASTTTATGTPEPAASPSSAAPSAPPPAVTASAPPLPPAAPAGPPAPPISQ
jgi:hypothetical protein